MMSNAFDADEYLRTRVPFFLGQLLGALDRKEYDEARRLVREFTNDLMPRIGGQPYRDQKR